MDKDPNLFEKTLHKKITRKKFLKLGLLGMALLPFYNHFSREASAELSAAPGAFNGRVPKNIKGEYDLAIVRGDDPYAITKKAVEAMGGMERFVKKGSTVVVKPNIGWDRTVEQAANTNPQVVAAVIDMAFAAGAKKVRIFDVTCNDPRRCYINSGIENTVKEHGAEVFVPDEWDMIAARFSYASPMENWPILRDAVECDSFINIPILKHHRLSGLTLSMKNLMGICGGNRGTMHRDIGVKLVDLTDFINPDLTIIDAYRVLLRNGPTGGNLADVELKKTVVAATDSTLADAYAATIVNVDPMSIPNIAVAAGRGFGSVDIAKARKFEVTV